MFEIAGGILLAVAILAVLVATLRYIVLALSIVFCLAMTAGVWLLLTSVIGQWWASAVLIAGFAILFWSANRDPPLRKMIDVGSTAPERDFGRKSS